jgi:hypothetical protein
MMGAALKIIGYAIAMNIAIGIMLNAVPIFRDNPQYQGGFSYDAGSASTFSDGLRTTVNPSSVMQSASNLIYRVLDMVTIGLVSKIANVLDAYVYGIIILLSVMFRGLLEPSVWSWFFARGIGIGYILMNIMYAYALFLLWTGKPDIMGED